MAQRNWHLRFGNTLGIGIERISGWNIPAGMVQNASLRLKSLHWFVNTCIFPTSCTEPFQQSISALSNTDPDAYYLEDRTAFQTYSYEYAPSTGTNTDGYAYWLQASRAFVMSSLNCKSHLPDVDGYSCLSSCLFIMQDDTVTFHLKETGLAGDPSIDMSQRLIPREPMYMIMNLGMAENFNPSTFNLSSNLIGES